MDCWSYPEGEDHATTCEGRKWDKDLRDKYHPEFDPVYGRKSGVPLSQRWMLEENTLDMVHGYVRKWDMWDQSQCDAHHDMTSKGTFCTVDHGEMWKFYGPDKETMKKYGHPVNGISDHKWEPWINGDGDLIHQIRVFCSGWCRHFGQD